MKLLPLDKPTRRGIETLFRELTRQQMNHLNESKDYLEYRRLEDECDRLQEKLLDNPKLIALMKKAKAARDRYDAGWKSLYAKVQQVRRRYLAHGLTPSVVKEIQKLVKEANR